MSYATITHHPSPDLLLSYSAGSVSIGQAMCIATHLDYCPQCRTNHQRNNAIGGAMLVDANASAVNSESKKKVLDAIAARKTIQPINPLPKAETGADIPRPLRKVIPQGFAALKWQMATWSVKTCDLSKEEDGAALSLLKIKPGGKVGKHGHMGDEYTVIVKGSFSDEDGVYREGDFLLRNSEEQHTPMATKDSECICLTSQEAPLQFTGVFWRLVNPILRKNFFAH